MTPHTDEPTCESIKPVLLLMFAYERRYTFFPDFPEDCQPSTFGVAFNEDLPVLVEEAEKEDFVIEVKGRG